MDVVLLLAGAFIFAMGFAAGVLFCLLIASGRSSG